MFAFRFALLVFLCIFGFVVAVETSNNAAADKLKLATIFSALVVSGLVGDDGDDDEKQQKKREQKARRTRTRRFVHSAFHELGPHVRRAHVMDAASFWELRGILKPNLESKKQPTHRRK